MILDTSALVAIFFGEPEAQDYVKLIHSAESPKMSAATFVEFSMVIERQLGPDASLQCDLFLRRAAVQIVAVDVEQAYVARQAFLDFGKGRHPAGLNFGDCFSYALARTTGEPLLFKGTDFSQTDIQGVR